MLQHPQGAIMGVGTFWLFMNLLFPPVDTCLGSPLVIDQRTPAQLQQCNVQGFWAVFVWR